MLRFWKKPKRNKCDACHFQEEFLGGMRAVIASKHILIDNSFKTLLSEAKSNFTFDGGKIDG